MVLVYHLILDMLAFILTGIRGILSKNNLLRDPQVERTLDVFSNTLKWLRSTQIKDEVFYSKIKF